MGLMWIKEQHGFLYLWAPADWKRCSLIEHFHFSVRTPPQSFKLKLQLPWGLAAATRYKAQNIFKERKMWFHENNLLQRRQWWSLIKLFVKLHSSELPVAIIYNTWTQICALKWKNFRTIPSSGKRETEHFLLRLNAVRWFRLIHFWHVYTCVLHFR